MRFAYGFANPKGPNEDDEDDEDDEGIGAELDSFPSGLTAVPITIRSRGGSKVCIAISGFSGVSQDPQTLALRAELGWIVYEKAFFAKKNCDDEDDEGVETALQENDDY
eukprot:SAG11_NODE_2585_length_3194_cov_4.598061_2_plen_109_part_00